MEENPVQNVATIEDRTRHAYPHPSWRPLFLVLLVAILFSALATTYILTTGKRPTFVNEKSSLEADNPFSGQPESTNPFVSDAVTSNSSNPFAQNNTANPFTQFDTDSSNTSQAGSSGEYQNPF